MRVWHLVAARTGTGKALEPAADALVVELSRAGGVLSVYPELSPSVNVPNWPTKGSMPPPRPPMNAPRLPLCASGVEARVAAVFEKYWDEERKLAKPSLVRALRK